MEQRMDMMVPLTGEVYLNGYTDSDKIDVSTISSLEALTEATNSIINTQALTILWIQNLQGSKHKANMLLQFFAERITRGQLTDIEFSNWQGPASEIESQTL